MKKIFAVTAFIFTAAMAVSANAEIKMNYVNDNMSTTAAHYSLAGHCDPQYPLYINGNKVDVTKDGYFSYYADLKIGKNIFSVENTSSRKTYTITRTAINKTESSDPFKPISFVGKVNMDNPTVRSRPDEANDDLITPYVTGTLVYITGENSEYYRTKHDNYLYKSAIDKTTEGYGANTVRALSCSGNEFTFVMDRPTEYAVSLMPDGIKVILYDTKGGVLPNPDSSMFSSIRYEKDAEGDPVYTLYFTQKGKYIGYKPVFENGSMKIILNEKSTVEKGTLKGATIVLDAGHGGEDAGTLGLGNIYEKTVTLSITNMLKDYLESKGAEVILTRADDTYVALGTRTAKINEVMPDVAVSIHCNSRNEWEDFGAAKGTLDLYTYDSTTLFVEKISETMNAPYEKNNLALTRLSVCPAVLIETGYMSNPTEYSYLTSEAGQKDMAQKIGQAVEKYFGEI